MSVSIGVVIVSTLSAPVLNSYERKHGGAFGVISISQNGFDITLDTLGNVGR